MACRSVFGSPAWPPLDLGKLDCIKLAIASVCENVSTPRKFIRFLQLLRPMMSTLAFLTLCVAATARSTTPAQCPSNSSTRVMYGSGSMKHLNVTDWAGCCMACAATDGCLAWDFDTAGFEGSTPDSRPESP